MADRDGGPVVRPPQPGAMRSFLRGLRVSVVRVPFRHGLPFKNADPFAVKLAGTGTGMIAGFVTMAAGSPDVWHWNVATDTGVAMMSATAGSWVAYGLAKGGAAVVRHTVEKGRRDLIQQGEIE